MTREIIHERRGEREVKRFAEAMIEKLNEPKNLAKESWNECHVDYLVYCLWKEINEVELVLKQKMSCFASTKERKQEILKECADVANFAMMIADKVGALE